MALVTATLDGIEGDTTGSLVLDTGAGYLALDRDLARVLGISDSAATHEPIGISSRPLPRLMVGKLVRDQVRQVLTVDAGIVRRALDRPVLGLLGHEPLRDHALWIDYRTERVALIPSTPAEDGAAPIRASREALREVLSGAATPLRFQLLGDGKIVLRGRISDPRPPRFTPWLNWILDTGSSKCVLFE
jgi:hypothetical protein